MLDIWSFKNSRQGFKVVYEQLCNISNVSRINSQCAIKHNKSIQFCKFSSRTKDPANFK
ncbi:hypothetical protein DYY67_1341 [Candidatus Nitrosotalea sp. TS]|nr:hypothetical protein [Candidatus Nitrosotalea sp. TS]